jgi:multicomponent Na+:H+ antiporter subunit A
MLIGAFTKSAQVPFHTWLPGAMAAPTPVSAYLHSATLVKAGVYLVARLAPIFATVAPWRPLVVTVGLATMLVGGYRALRQFDLKLVLAYGTISQLGFLIILFGIGTGWSLFAGTAMILAHGIFKACLFMVVGVIDKSAGSRDLRRLPNLWQPMPAVVIAGVIAAASMAGLPPAFGFISKEAALEALLQGGLGALGPIALAGIVVGSVLTFAYSARFVAGTLGVLVDPAGGARVDPSDIVRPSFAFGGPAQLLAALTLLLGFVPLLADGLVNSAARALDPTWQGYGLALWHGLNAALGLSALIVGTGAGLYALRGRVTALQDLVPPLPDSRRAYLSTVAGLLISAKRVTAVVQNGSLPTYQLVILTTLLALPGVALVRTGAIDLDLPLATDLGQVATALVVVVATVCTVSAARRFAAVLFLGAVGYGVAVLFVLQGAPDLALTQLLIETLSLVIFALVLRTLPTHFTRRPDVLSRTLRGVVAGGVGLFFGLFALIAGAARTAAPVGEEYLTRALPEASGRNVVNVILVDFRALDTLGEIVVLLVAALGIVTLVTASRSDRATSPPPEPPSTVSARVPADAEAAVAVDAPAEQTLGTPGRSERASS